MQNDIKDILNEIYDAYEGKVKEASGLWKSDYSCSSRDDEERDNDDEEDLKCFKELLQLIEEATYNAE